MTEHNERLKKIDDWWGGFPGAFACVSRLEDRLRLAFRRVLLAMREEDFEHFMELNPTIVCEPHLNGSHYTYYLPVPPGADGVTLHVLYFAPGIGRKSDDALAALVAHEAAHLGLRHDESHGGPEDEAAADALAEKWGFRKSYSACHLKKMGKRSVK